MNFKPPTEESLDIIRALWNRALREYKTQHNLEREPNAWELRMLVSDVDITISKIGPRAIINAPTWRIDASDHQGFRYEDEDELKRDLFKIAMLTAE